MYVFFWVFPRRPIVVCRRFGTLYQFHLQDGTDRGFRNVGKLQSDAGEIPKRIHTKNKTYPGADICSDHNVIVMKYKLQRKKKISKPVLNNSKWAVSKLKKEKQIENYNNRIKQNLNYTQTETTDTYQQWENLKHAITTAAKETVGKLKQQPRRPWISEKTITPREQRRKHKHDKNKSEYNRLRNLINRQAKKDKEEWLGQYCEEIENSLMKEVLKSHTNLLESFFSKTQNKIYYY